MVLTQAASAPVDSELHGREQWSELVNRWDPSLSTYDLQDGKNNWMLAQGSADCHPSKLLTEMIYRSTLEGNVTVIKVPEEDLNGTPGTLGENLLNFQQGLARAFTDNLVHETGDISYHMKQFAPDGSFDGHGFRNQFAKVLPPHYDLALYSNTAGKAYAPAHITLIAWGTRGAERKEVTNHFFDVASFIEDHEIAEPGGMALCTVAPSIYCLEKGFAIHNEEGASYHFPVEIPEGAITIFPNRGLAHGAEYSTFADSKELNRKLTAQEQGGEPVNRDLMVPIDVLLL